MGDVPASSSEVVKAGVTKLCADFTQLVAPLGFVRTNSRSREWTAQIRGRVCSIYFHRSGSTYGAPRNNSVSIRVHFSFKSVDGATPPADHLTTDKLRDERGYGYHLRFNAFSWSTYDRCLDDLLRVTRDQGIPWFELHGA
jgi:hypothetical protein